MKGVNYVIFFCCIMIGCATFIFCGDRIITVNAQSSNIYNRDISLVYHDKQWKYSISETLSDNFVISGDIQRRNTLINNIGYENAYNLIINMGVTSDMAIEYLLPNFSTVYQSIINTVERDCIEPELVFTPNSECKFRTKPARNGVRIDKERLFRDILNGDTIVSISTIDITPRYSEAELMRHTNLRSRESTSYVNSESGRRHNLLKAMKVFDGVRLDSGEILSFNHMTGLRGYAQGYKDAIIIVDGKFTKGIGGGVCQASTTLYNSALMAGLEIIRVRRHSLPVNYVQAGFDAMVNDDSVDMRFRNNTSHPIFIHTYSLDERVYAEVYGESMSGVTYERYSEKIRDITPGEATIIPDINGEHIDKITYKGEFYTERYPKNGYEVKAYLRKYQSGKLIETKLIRQEIYLPQNAILYEGVREKEQKPTPV